MKYDPAEEKDLIMRAFALAEAEKPAYGEFYPLLQAIFLLQADMKGSMALPSVDIASSLVESKWREGFPLLRRWDFPIDAAGAETMLDRMKGHIPEGNLPLAGAHSALSEALKKHPEYRERIWTGFLQHETEPWKEWIDTDAVDMASLFFWTRNCLRPSIERTAADLTEKHPVPKDWLKGYCPVCGSLPSLLHLEGEGERKASCSWCGTQWGLHRLQCPMCDNRYHESLGYIYIETEAQYRVQYCNLCKTYFKLIDAREKLYPPFMPLEEWTTLHLDLLAQQAGWQQAPSPSPAVYG
ncbi:MAG: formate dehydrogenase accessory protein FdhE [Acidobacteriota bacterium]